MESVKMIIVYDHEHEAFGLVKVKVCGLKIRSMNLRCNGMVTSLSTAISMVSFESLSGAVEPVEIRKLPV